MQGGRRPYFYWPVDRWYLLVAGILALVLVGAGLVSLRTPVKPPGAGVPVTTALSTTNQGTSAEISGVTTPGATVRLPRGGRCSRDDCRKRRCLQIHFARSWCGFAYIRGGRPRLQWSGSLQAIQHRTVSTTGAGRDRRPGQAVSGPRCLGDDGRRARRLLHGPCWCHRHQQGPNR